MKRLIEVGIVACVLMMTGFSIYTYAQSKETRDRFEVMKVKLQVLGCDDPYSDSEVCVSGGLGKRTRLTVNRTVGFISGCTLEGLPQVTERQPDGQWFEIKPR